MSVGVSRDPVDATLSRKFFDGSVDDAPLVVAEHLGDGVRDNPVGPFLEVRNRF